MNTGERVVTWIWDHRWACLAACLLITAAAGWPLGTLRVDNAIDIWFVENDASLVAYRDFQRRFGNDEVVVVAFHEPEGLLNPAGFRLLRQASRALEGVEGVARVVSLATVSDLQASERGLEIAPLLPAAALTPEQTGALRRHILADHALAGPLVSRDGTTAVVLAYMQPLPDMDARRGAILARIDEALETLGPSFRKAGIGVIYTALNRLSNVDSGVLIAAAYGLIVVLLWLLFGRLAPTLVSLAVVAMAVVWLMGAYSAAGRNVNMITMIMPTLVSIIGVANCVHILEHVARMPPTGSRKERVVKGVGFMFRPCLFNTLTTAAGFAALATSPMPVIRDLGIFCAGGLIAVFVVTMVLCTWALAWEGAEPVAALQRRLKAFVASLAALGLTRGKHVLVVAALLSLAAVLGVSRLVVDTYSIDFLFADHPVRQDSDFIESRLGAYTPLEFVVRAEDGVMRPEVIKAVRRWQRAAEVHDEVGWSSSAVDLLARIERAGTGANGSDFRVFDDPEALEQALALCCTSPDTHVSALVDLPNALRVTFGIRMQSARGIARTIERVLADARFPAGVTATPSGYLPLYVRMIDHIVSSQILSFGLAFLVVFATIGLLFRSVRAVALAIPANLLPVLVTAGAMGLLGIRLDVATVTIAAVVLGIVVDDTILLLYRLRHEQRRCNTPADAVRATVSSTGHSIAMTTVVLVLGFLVLGLAGIKSIVWFGLLISLAMLVALLADLCLVPALVARFRPHLDTVAARPGDGVRGADSQVTRPTGHRPNLVDAQ